MTNVTWLLLECCVTIVTLICSRFFKHNYCHACRVGFFRLLSSPVLLRKVIVRLIIVSRFSVRLSFLAFLLFVYDELINVNFLTTLKKTRNIPLKCSFGWPYRRCSVAPTPRGLPSKIVFTVVRAFFSPMLAISGYQVHVKHYFVLLFCCCKY